MDDGLTCTEVSGNITVGPPPAGEEDGGGREGGRWEGGSGREREKGEGGGGREREREGGGKEEREVSLYMYANHFVSQDHVLLLDSLAAATEAFVLGTHPPVSVSWTVSISGIAVTTFMSSAVSTY